MGRKKGGSKAVRDKVEKDKKALQQKRQANRKDSSSSSERENLFSGFGTVDLKDEDKPKRNAFISEVIGDMKPPGKLVKPKGLSNLGNTCFFNSVMQVLSQCPELRERLDKIRADGISWEAIHCKLMHKDLEESTQDDKICSLTTTLPEANQVTAAFVDFLREMRVSNKGVVSPNRLFNQIGNKCHQFKGRDQQDSHELLRSLLDLIKTDEISRHRRAVMSAFNVSGKAPNVDDDTKASIKSFGHAANFTNIDALFGGYTLSSLQCDECDATSQILEPFFDLSLPVVDVKQQHGAFTRKGNKNGKNTPDSADDLQELPNFDEANECKPKAGKISKKERRAAKTAAKKIARKATVAAKTVESAPTAETPTTEVVESVPGEDADSAIMKSDETEAVDTKVEDVGPVKVGVNVTVSPGKVNVNVDIESQGDKDLDCKVAVNHINSIGSKQLVECTNFDEVGLDVLSELSRENLFLNNELSRSRASSLEVQASDEDEGNVSGGSDQSFNEKDFCEEIEQLDLNDKSEVIDEIDVSEKSDAGDELIESEEKVEPADRLRTTSLSCGDEEMRTKIKWSLTTLTPKPEIPGDGSTATVEACLSLFTRHEILAGSNKLFCEKCTEKAKKAGGTEKVYTNATKQLLIAYPPPILTLHLKRFQAQGFRCVTLRKISRNVAFPLELDLSPWVSKLYTPLGKQIGVKESTSMKYNLFGIVEHSGSLRGGHYTAFVKLMNTDRKNTKYERLKPYIATVEKLLQSISLEDFETNGDHPAEASDSGTPEEGKWFHISDSHVATTTIRSVLSAQAYLLFYERL